MNGQPKDTSHTLTKVQVSPWDEQGVYYCAACLAWGVYRNVAQQSCPAKEERL